MFGIDLGFADKWVTLAYLLCIASAVLCVLYGLATWRRGEEHVEREDIQWVEEEKKSEDEL